MISEIRKIKKKLPKITTLRNKLDKVFNEYIRKRDGKCILTESKEKLVCSHYYGKKAAPNLRWNEDNAHAMSMASHWRHHHGMEAEYALWMFCNYGLDFMGLLSSLAVIKVSYSREEYLRLIEFYSKKLKELSDKNKVKKEK